MAGVGDSFMLPKPRQETEHLWVLVTNPDPDTHEAIMVNVTTLRPHSDRTTILQLGDHPFIQKPSVVFYNDAMKVNTPLLDQAIQSGTCRAHHPMGRVILQRIQAGLLASSLTPNKIKAAYTAALNAGRIA